VEILNYMPLAAGAVWSVLGELQTILAVVFGLGMVIFFHELGHFAVAKWCNVHVERFSIGIGPIIWSHQRGETEYALSVQPLGGYVKMLGQDDMDPNQMTSSEIAENPRSYSSKTVLQRMAIISAGVMMNVATGFLFFAIGYWNGVLEPAPVVGGVRAGFPAWEAGLRAGDRVLSVNGDPIRSFVDLQEAILLSSGDLTIDVERNGKALATPIVLTPVKASPGRSIGVIPAMTTAFREDGTVDHDFVGRHANWLIDNGCTGIVALGSLGEGATLALPEKIEVLRTCVKALNGRAPVVAGVAALSTAEAVTIARAAHEGAACPDDEELARIYGTNSLGRIRRLLEHYERAGLIVVRTDFSGRRSVAIPELSLSTAPLEA